MGREQDIERERNAISIGTRQMRYGKEKRKGETLLWDRIWTVCF
jgi:hypothetical protein